MARPYKYRDETRQLTLRFPTELIRALDEEAKRRNCPRAEVIIEALVEKHPPRKIKNVFL